MGGEECTSAYLGDANARNTSLGRRCLTDADGEQPAGHGRGTCCAQLLVVLRGQAGSNKSEAMHEVRGCQDRSAGVNAGV
jgi:hypothetical protein